MHIRYFALVLGIVYIGAGLLGFVPPLRHTPPADAPGLAVDQGYGYLLGLFPVNVAHNLFHLAIGVWGVAAYFRLGAAVTYARGVAIIYGLLTILGMIPATYTTFGLIPIFGHDVWLHAATAAVAAYFGFAARVDRPDLGHMTAPTA